MIVHQLQRLAAEPRPSPAVRAKIPRMAVGICYFLEHPDPGVQHQAAGALRLLLQQHLQLLLKATELQELRSALQQHANSSDVVVSECCAASLALLHQHEASNEDELRQPQQPSEPENNVETLESLDLFSVVLGLRGLLRCPSNRSLLTFKHQRPQTDYAGDEQRQERQGNEWQEERQRMLELLQRDLQLRLVRVWGVSSATVTLNAARLLQQVALMDGNKADSGSAAALEHQAQQNEEGDGVAVVCIRLSRRAQRLQQQLRELRAAIGPLTLLLDSELLQKAPRSPDDTPSPNDVSRSASSDSRAPTAQQQQRQHRREQQSDGYLDEELKDGWEGAGENGGDTAGERADGSNNGGFSFFSANSALFAQSRFMGGMIAPVESNAEMSARLKAEKERKAAARSQSQGGLIDKLLSRLGPGAGLL